MKGRESGMPPQEVWEEFFNPAEILKTMGLDGRIMDVAEFGCGYGTFTIPAARLIKGTVHALDIDGQMIEKTKREAEENGLRNVNPVLRDFLTEGTGLKDESVDYCMVFNILHVEHPERMLGEAGRILRKGGRLGIIHWNYDASTPRGPSLAIRPKPEQCIAWATASGFVDPRRHDLKPYHYGIVMRKMDTPGV